MKKHYVILISFVSLFFLAFKTEKKVEHQKFQNQTKMKIAVWDTYVTRKDGKIMHFDIIAPETEKDTAVIYGYGREYLKSKGQEGQPLSSEECRFCHVRQISPQWESDIKNKGYFILEMENCN
ncbi:MAG TPA: DUF2024 family protein [Flavobacterium sp.]|nr:DUF2024 family protein [Flavobacterium sp.]